MIQEFSALDGAILIDKPSGPTSHDVVDAIRRHFGISYHPEHVRKIVKFRLHWSSQKPQKKAKQRNDEKVAH